MRRVVLVMLLLLLLLIALSASCTHNAGPSALVRPGRQNALEACRRWETLTPAVASSLRPLPRVESVIRLANDATNQNLLYLTFRDHMISAATAASRGDLIAWRSGARTVLLDCHRIEAGQAPSGMSTPSPGHSR